MHDARFSLLILLYLPYDTPKVNDDAESSVDSTRL